MYITRNGNEMSVSYYANEKEIYDNGAEGIKVEIKADSKREDFEGKDTTIFDQIDTNKDKVVSYDELDAYVTNIKKEADKNDALDKYIAKQKAKGDKAFETGFWTGMGLVFAGGALLGGGIGLIKGLEVGHILKKAVKNVAVKKAISKTCKLLGAGIMGLGGGVTVATFLGFPVGGGLGITAKEIFENKKSEEELKKDFEKKYKEKEPDKSKEWAIDYDGKNANNYITFSLQDLLPQATTRM